MASTVGVRLSHAVMDHQEGAVAYHSLSPSSRQQDIRKDETGYSQVKGISLLSSPCPLIFSASRDGILEIGWAKLCACRKLAALCRARFLVCNGDKFLCRPCELTKLCGCSKWAGMMRLGRVMGAGCSFFL